jgi:hypothetical protein
VADTSPARGRWDFSTVPPGSRSIVELIRAGTLDADLAATIWLLVEARVPLLVAADEQDVGKTTLLRALLDFVSPETHVVELAGTSETFDWLPQASELGWPGKARASREASLIRPDTTVLLVPEFSDHLPAYTWGDGARLAFRAASIGYGLAGTIHANALDEVFEKLGGRPVNLTGDELSHLGVVLVLHLVAGDRRRVVAAHYVRPVSRDMHGHLQRLGPAVLATWNPATDTFEHFGWGIVPELALRVARRAGDFELETAARRAFLDELVVAGVADVQRVKAALNHYRTTSPAATSIGRPTSASHPLSPAPN